VSCRKFYPGKYQTKTFKKRQKNLKDCHSLPPNTVVYKHIKVPKPLDLNTRTLVNGEYF
jgi:hypothetical protein